MIRRRPSRPHRLWLPLLLIAVLPACDGTDAQEEFEDVAFARPFTGITETSETGDVLEADPDDWRVAPRYLNTVTIDPPAYPNPTDGRPVTVQVNILFDDALGSQLALYGFTGTSPPRLGLLDTIPGSSGVGSYALTFDPATLRQEGGLRRVFVYDGAPGRGALVSYGDVVLE